MLQVHHSDCYYPSIVLSIGFFQFKLEFKKKSSSGATAIWHIFLIWPIFAQKWPAVKKSMLATLTKA